MQVCGSEADVKRALQAWSEYRASGKQPIERYQRSTPAKRTIATMWGKHGSRAAAGDAGGAGGISQVPITHAHASISPEGQHKSQPATRPEVQAPGASTSLSNSSAQPLGAVSMAGEDTNSAAEPSSGLSEPIHNSGAVAEQASKSHGRHRQRADTGNAFAMLMTRAKLPVEAPTAKPPGHGGARRQQYQPNSWKDALRQVALNPERYVIRCLCWPLS